MEAVWRLIIFLLEGAVFLLVGLQLRHLVTDLETGLSDTIQATALVFAVIVVARFAWLYPAEYLVRLLPRSAKVPGGYPRDLFVFVAFAIIVLTLLVQGTTLPMVANRLGVKEDTSTEDALAEAAVQHQASRAALARLEEKADGAPASVVERLRAIADDRSNVAWERLGSQEQETPSAAYGRLRREMISAERHVFKVARNEGRIPEEVLTRAQRDLDLEESQLTRSDD